MDIHMYFWRFGKMYDPSLVPTREDLALPEMVDDGSPTSTCLSLPSGILSKILSAFLIIVMIIIVIIIIVIINTITGGPR